MKERKLLNDVTFYVICGTAVLDIVSVLTVLLYLQNKKLC